MLCLAPIVCSLTDSREFGQIGHLSFGSSELTESVSLSLKDKSFYFVSYSELLDSQNLGTGKYMPCVLGQVAVVAYDIV